MDTIRQHAKEFIAEREAPAYIANDGKQILLMMHTLISSLHPLN